MGGYFSWQGLSDLHQLNLKEIRLVSLDIFDTLLHRTVKIPSDVFVLVAQQAHQQGSLDPAVCPEQFRLIRIEMEKNARKLAVAQRDNSEVTFAEIWAQAPKHWANATQLAALELETELAVSFPNPYLLDFCRMLQQQQIPFQLTSDTYFSRDFIQALLGKSGLNIAECQLMLSQEMHANKYQGALFDLLLAQHPQLKPEQILHIGDDTVADMVQSQTRGIRSLHLQHIHLPVSRQQRWLLSGAAGIPHPLQSLNRLGYAHNWSNNADPELARFGSSLYGPVLAAFGFWVVKDAMKQGITRLCPIMREARVFKPLLEQAIDRLSAKIQVVEFYTSRKAAYLAQMGTLDSAAITQFRNRRSYSLNDLIKELELPAAPPELAQTAGLRLNDIPDQLALNQWLQSETVQHAALMTSQRQQQYLRQYCQQCFAGNTVAMVDIGPGGNSLAWVANAIGEDANAIRMNYLLYSIPELARHLAAGHRYQSYLPLESATLEKMRVINRCPEPLEILLTGRDQTTLSYQQLPDGTIGPVTAHVFQQPQQELRLLDFMQGATLAMQHLCLLSQYVDTKYWLTPATRAAQLHELYLLLELPTQSEAQSLGSLLFDDNYGSDSYAAICSSADQQLLQQTGVNRFMQLCRQQWGYNGMAVRWPQAVVTLHSPYFLTQQYLSSFNDTEFKLLCFTLISRALDAGITEVVVYGAGELGQQMVQQALEMGLHVQALVDSNPKLHGLQILNRPVVSLQQAFDTGAQHFLVASSAFSRQICAQLREFYQQHSTPLTLFAINEG
jgi:FMN phosphatase YigB (HAD superfamily)